MLSHASMIGHTIFAHALWRVALWIPQYTCMSAITEMPMQPPCGFLDCMGCDRRGSCACMYKGQDSRGMFERRPYLHTKNEAP